MPLGVHNHGLDLPRLSIPGTTLGALSPTGLGHLWGLHPLGTATGFSNKACSKLGRPPVALYHPGLSPACFLSGAKPLHLLFWDFATQASTLLSCLRWAYVNTPRLHNHGLDYPWDCPQGVRPLLGPAPPWEKSRASPQACFKPGLPSLGLYHPSHSPEFLLPGA
jgi:hypothetical protein